VISVPPSHVKKLSYSFLAAVLAAALERVERTESR
jgi:hypothetical protein